MKHPFVVLSTTLLLCLSAAVCHAEKGADLKPTFAKAGKQSVQDTFSSATLGKSWAANKGDWQVKDGVLVGAEKESDNHPAVLNLGHLHRNSIIRYSFKLDGAAGFNLSYNHAKGHLFRIAVTPEGLTMNKDKDKKDAKSKTESLGKGAGKFERGQWYTMLVEIKGGKVTVQTDNGVKISADNAALDVDKTGFRFVTSKASVSLDDVSVWEVEP